MESMDIFIILALGLFVGWMVRAEYNQGVILWQIKDLCKAREENRKLKNSLREAEGRLLRLTPLIYPFMMDLKKIKIVTVEYKEERLQWDVHTFDAFEFISDYRRGRDLLIKLGKTAWVNQDTYAYDYLRASCKFEWSENWNYYYMTPLVNLMNYDIAKDYYDWNEKEIMKR